MLDVTVVLLDDGLSSTAIMPVEIFHSAGSLWNALHDEEAAEQLGKRCRRKGLLVSPEGETVLLIPALTIDAKTAEEGLDILEACA